MAYSDYTFYTDKYGGLLSYETYTKYLFKADLAINTRIANQPENAKTLMMDHLKMVECELIDYMDTANNLSANTMNGLVTSQSNDGVSVSYNTDIISKVIKGDDVMVQGIFKKWLTKPYNLLYDAIS